MEQQIVNRVANSPLVTIDLEDYVDKGEKVPLDLKPFLFQEMILREKDFRISVKEYDWEQYQNKNVYLFCSVDSIIPAWAYMIVISNLAPFVNEVVVGNRDDLEKALIDQAISKIKDAEVHEKKVVIKGCGGIENRDYAYGQITKKIINRVSTLMYGEPCSTVPIFKNLKKGKK
jgi:hypothetical protein